MQCEGVLITCEDFHLHQRPGGRNLTAELIKTLGFDCDLVTRAGAILDLVHRFFYTSRCWFREQWTSSRSRTNRRPKTGR